MARKLDWAKQSVQKKVRLQGIECNDAPLLRIDGTPHRKKIGGNKGKFPKLRKRIADEKRAERRQLSSLKRRLAEMERTGIASSEMMNRVRRRILALEKQLNPFPAAPNVGKLSRRRSKTDE